MGCQCFPAQWMEGESERAPCPPRPHRPPHQLRAGRRTVAPSFRTGLKMEACPGTAAVCEDIAAHVEGGDWRRAARGADAALGRGGSSGLLGHTANDCDAAVCWLAAVWAKGAWEGGCVAESATALQLARGLEVSAARQRRRLAAGSGGGQITAADVEEEASAVALDANQLCCTIVMRLRSCRAEAGSGSAGC